MLSNRNQYTPFRLPPVLVINNLAYLLSVIGTDEALEEALGLIEPLVKKIESNKYLFMGSIDEVKETYAWILYKAGNLEEACKIYGTICSETERLDFLINYAEVLHADKNYEKARKIIKVVMNSTDSMSSNMRDRANNLNGEIMIGAQKKFDRQTEFK